PACALEDPDLLVDPVVRDEREDHLHGRLLLRSGSDAAQLVGEDAADGLRERALLERAQGDARRADEPLHLLAVIALERRGAVAAEEPARLVALGVVSDRPRLVEQVDRFERALGGEREIRARRVDARDEVAGERDRDERRARERYVEDAPHTPREEDL